MRALLTGAGGFCGRHLLRHLQLNGVETHTIGPRPVGGTYHYSEPANVATLTQVVSQVRPDYVFHLAGTAVAQNLAEYYLINVTYAACLLQALAQTGQADCPVLLAGTCAEYGMISDADLPIVETMPPHPYNHYGVSKLAQTLMGVTLARSGRRLIMVRPFNIIGAGMPDHLVVRSFVRQAAAIWARKQPPVLAVGNLGSARDFIAVSDVVEIYWQLVQTPAAYGEVINVCSGTAVSIRALLDKLLALAGVAVEVRVDPLRCKAVDVPVHYGSAEKLRRILGNGAREDLDTTLTKIWSEAMAQA